MRIGLVILGTLGAFVMRGSGVQFPPAAPLQPVEIARSIAIFERTGQLARPAFSTRTEQEPTDSLAHRWHTAAAFVPRLFVPAPAQPMRDSAPAAVGVPAWERWCAHSNSCPPSALDRTWRGPVAQLAAVNRAVNGGYVYGREYGDEWHPVSQAIGGWGDCEDFALEKRARLLALGWPRGNLRVAVMRGADGWPHAVLLAWTAGAWWALDILRADPAPPAALPYSRWYIEPWQGRAWLAFEPTP